MVGGITITDGAAEKIRAFLVGTKAGQGLRVQILEGSCSGFEHKLGIDPPESEDHVFENTGARILLDSKSILHLDGRELDYRSGLMQSGFVFNSPNVKGTCGCGTSFSA